MSACSNSLAPRTVIRSTAPGPAPTKYTLPSVLLLLVEGLFMFSVAYALKVARLSRQLFWVVTVYKSNCFKATSKF